MTSIIQIASILMRLVVFSYSIYIINKTPYANTILLSLGYLPFLALVDELIKAYSRSVFLNRLSNLELIYGFRSVFANIGLAIIFWGLIISLINKDHRLAMIVVILSYIFGGFCLIWEQWMARNSNARKIALFELCLLVFVLVGSAFINGHEYLLVLGFISLPLSRLIVLITPKNKYNLEISKTDGMNFGIISYTGFAIGQQIIGAISAAMPSIYSQITGDYTNLAKNLIIFRYVHSAAGAGSLFINAMASRIFYGTADQLFYSFEYAFLRRVANQLFLLVFIGLSASICIFVFDNKILAIILTVIALGLLNFESSLLMNCGLPNQSLIVQFIVFYLSTAIILVLSDENILGALLMFIFTFSIRPIWASIIKIHKRKLVEGRFKS